MLSVIDCVELERSNILDYAANSNEKPLKAATEQFQLRTKIDQSSKKERKNERQAAWKERVLHCKFVRKLKEMKDHLEMIIWKGNERGGESG